MTTSPTRLYRVRGTAVEVHVDETHACPQCIGGEKYDRGLRMVVACEWCGGVGRVLGDPARVWPTMLEVVEPSLEAGSPAGPSEESPIAV